jgi:hypothetical protein
MKLPEPRTRANYRARREAREFAASVKPGHTYYSVLDNHATYPGAPKQLLMEWKFTAPGRWIGQEARCGHLTAAGAWLGYGPLLANRPRGLMTPREAANRSVAGPDLADILAQATPVGV